MSIFDFHLHPGYDFHGNDSDPHKFVSELKKCGITKCAGSFVNKSCDGRDIAEYKDIISEFNRLAWEFHDIYPDFFVPGIHIHPDYVELSCQEIERHKARGGVLVGELIYYMMGWTFEHKNIYEILSVARDLDMTVSVHLPKKVAFLDSIMQNVQGLQLVVAHLDAYGLYDEQIALMQKYVTVYSDISAYGAQREGMLKDAVNKIGSERILFGTDYPGYSLSPFIDAVLNSGIRPQDAENILYNNANNLLLVK